jgi:hypothetical protein
MDFYLAEQDKIKGHYGLFYLSNKTIYMMEPPETASFFKVSPVFMLKRCIFPYFVPITHKSFFKERHLSEHANPMFVKVFSV